MWAAYEVDFSWRTGDQLKHDVERYNRIVAENKKEIMKIGFLYENIISEVESMTTNQRLAIIKPIITKVAKKANSSGDSVGMLFWNPENTIYECKERLDKVVYLYYCYIAIDNSEDGSIVKNLISKLQK